MTKDLSPGAKAALKEMMGGGTVPPGRSQRVLGDVKHTVATDAPPRIGDTRTDPVRPAAMARWGIAAAAAVIVASGIGLGLRALDGGDRERLSRAGHSAASYDRTRSVSNGVAPVRGRRPAGAASVNPPAPIENSIPTAVPAAATGAPAAATRDRPTPRPRPRTGTTLGQKPVAGVADPRDEMALLIDARRAVKAGEYRTALSRLGRHRRIYPRSTFHEERVLLEMRALCGDEQLRRAQKLIDRNRGMTRQLKQLCPGLSTPRP